MIRHLARVLIGLLFLFLAVSGVVPASARGTEVDVEMTVTPYLGGHVKYGEWLPLRVGLGNAGGDLQAEVRVDLVGGDGQASQVLPVSLPAGARKEVTLYVRPPSFAQSLSVQLLADDQILTRAEVPVSTHPQSDYLVAAVSPEPGALRQLDGLKLFERAVHLVPVAPSALPGRFEGLRSFDCLVLSGLNTSPLTPAQGAALETWVELGGRLVIGGGAGVHRTLAGLPPALRPVQPGETLELAHGQSLAYFAGLPAQMQGIFLATLPSDYSGESLIVQDGETLLVQEKVGAGWIAYLALDPTGSPFETWPGTPFFWSRLLKPGSALPAQAPHDVSVRVGESERVASLLNNLMTLDHPSVDRLAWLLGLYVLLIGPVNYGLLRALSRPVWAWLTIPLITLLFCAGGVTAYLQTRGADLIVNQISILSLADRGHVTQARVYLGLFSPAGARYDVRLGSEVLVSPMARSPWVREGLLQTQGSLEVWQGEPVWARDLEVDQWAMRTLEGETAWRGEPGLGADLSFEGSRVRGVLHNRLGRPVQGVILASGNRFARLGDVEAGQTKSFEARLEAAGHNYPFALVSTDPYLEVSTPRQLNLRVQILDAYLSFVRQDQNSLLLLGWTDLDPLGLEVPGVRADWERTTLVVSRLSLPGLGAGEGELVVVPPGYVTGRAIEPHDADCGPGVVCLGQEITLVYGLPPALRGLQPHRLTLHATLLDGVPADLAPSSARPSFWLYDWRAKAWVDLTKVEALADLSRFVAPSGGEIRLKLAKASSQMVRYQVDVGLEGKIGTGRK